VFIAHLPAGYISSKLLFSRFKAHGVTLKSFLFAGVLGAVAPDLDMLYFYFFDHRQYHHHTYVTHFPIVWVSCLLAATTWLYLSKSKTMATLAVIFSLNGLIHMVLDTVVGDIWWLAPMVDKPLAFFTVHPIYKPWWLNFILHWSFALEVGILLWALYIWHKGPDITVKRDVQETARPLP
jgi:hypothetical protein